MGLAITGTEGLRAVRVQAFSAPQQFGARSARARSASQGQPGIVRAQLVFDVGRFDRTGTVELIRDPARHQESGFGVARQACGSGLTANGNKRCDVGRYQAFHVGLQGKASVFLTGRCHGGHQGAGGSLA